MRIDNGKTVRTKDIADGEELQKPRLAGARLADDVHVPPAVGARQAEHGVVAAKVGGRDRADIIPILGADDWQVGRRLGGLAERPEDVRRFYVGVRQVVQRGDFFDVANKAVLAAKVPGAVRAPR